MFHKIMGIVGALAVIGGIVMVALSPRASGFFPNALDFLKCSGAAAIEADAPQPETDGTGLGTVAAPATETVREALPADTLHIETQNDTLTHN